jgi:hypothetical protein
MVKLLRRQLRRIASGLKRRHLPRRADTNLTVLIADLVRDADGAQTERIAAAIGSYAGIDVFASALVRNGTSATAARSSSKRASYSPTRTVMR